MAISTKEWVFTHLARKNLAPGLRVWLMPFSLACPTPAVADAGLT
jgi:hypothetical protein